MNKNYAFITLAIVLSFCLWLGFLNSKNIEREQAEAVVEMPQPTVARNSIAHIGKDSNALLTCTDLYVTVPPGSEMPSSYQEMLRAVLEPEGMVEVQQPCQQQFSDRVVWAMCTRRIVRNDGVSLDWSERHYSHSRVYSSDELMSECLSDDGTWTSASRDTIEWRRENRRLQMESLQQDMERAQADMDAMLSRNRYRR